MTIKYLSVTDVSKRLGISTAAVSMVSATSITARLICVSVSAVPPRLTYTRLMPS